ncbi:hypothetical protein [Acinetobacter sp. P1(2025)]|uniref:hypothetical protein n=1 Tax=Acinetobacter sp. P1(2025) TaxID=3446120 RepID=UPI003F53B33A
MYKLNAKKSASTQAVLDDLKVVNFSDLPQIWVMNVHSSCPDHKNGRFIYKGMSAINLAKHFTVPALKKLSNSQGIVFACTAKQWKYVPKSFPVINPRLSVQKQFSYDTALYLYSSEKEYVVERHFNVDDRLLVGLSKKEVDFVWDFCSWRLGEPCSNSNHKFGYQKMSELIALADSFFDFQIEKR